MKKFMLKVLKLFNNEKIVKKILKLHTALMTSGIVLTPTLAVNSNTGSIDNIIIFICDWIGKIGSVAALLGGAAFAFGYSTDNQETKIRSLMAIAGGLMAVAISKSPDLFGG